MTHARVAPTALGIASAVVAEDPADHGTSIKNRLLFVYAYSTLGLATWILSWISNVTATSSVGYKAWCAIVLRPINMIRDLKWSRIHRAALRSVFGEGSGPGTIRSMRLLCLLVESGLRYSLIWVGSLLRDSSIY